MSRILAVFGMLLALLSFAPDDPAKAPDIGTAYKVPYHLTLTNHYLVRVKINGKGPFNFLVDTGAPALFIGTEAAKKVGLTPAKTGFWTPVEKLELEGGIALNNVKARVDDPFQLVGMNAMGLPGARIDGILGFTILARFKMEFDPTQDRMNWTRLDFSPPDPFITDEKEREAPAELQAMNALGPLMKVASLFLGKQPEDVYQPQGLLGIELDAQLKVVSVLTDSPAAKVGIAAGDKLLKLRDTSVSDLKSAHSSITSLRPGDRVSLVVERDGQSKNFTLYAAEGF